MAVIEGRVCHLGLLDPGVGGPIGGQKPGHAGPSVGASGDVLLPDSFADDLSSLVGGDAAIEPKLGGVTGHD